MYVTNILADSVYGVFVHVSLTFKQSVGDGTDKNAYNRPFCGGVLLNEHYVLASDNCHHGAFELS